MQTTVMVTIFIIQLVTSIFGAHYLIPNIPETVKPDISSEYVSGVNWSDLLSEQFWGGSLATISYLVDSNQATKLLAQAVTFSWKMMWFAVPGCPAIFNYIWLIMTFTVLWILVDKIRGHNT